MLIHDCIPCQHGDHDGHHRIVQTVPEGMMGGQECHCEGECRERASRPLTQAGPPPTGPWAVAESDRRDAMLRGFAIWVTFMAVLFVVVVGITWVLS